MMKRTGKPSLGAALTSAFALALFAGCTHLGPQTVAVNRFDYTTSIADSWKQQTLLNIVKVRYRDSWFWIDNGDLKTKRALTEVMFLFTLADAGSREKLPLITIPAQ